MAKYTISKMGQQFQAGGHNVRNSIQLEVATALAVGLCIQMSGAR